MQEGAGTHLEQQMQCAWKRAYLLLYSEEGECCANLDVYTGGWLGCGITLTNFFGQLKYKCSNNQAKELCLEHLDANLRGRDADATLFAGCLSQGIVQLCCVMRPALSLIW